MLNMTWARPQQGVVHILRRGAWYRVVGRRSDNVVVLDVNRKNVPVDVRLLQFRGERPKTWSVVRVSLPQPKLPPDWGPTYVVCPNCAHRQKLVNHPGEMVCDECEGLYNVEWEVAV
jgi:hypothetical protein